MFLRGITRRGLGRLGSQAMPLSLAQATPNAPNCPWWMWFEGNYLTCIQQPGLMTEQNAQIQTVPYNAAQAGYPANVVATAQAAADAQMANTPADVANVTQAIENSQVDQSPITYFGNELLNPNVVPQPPSAWPTWLWVLLAGGIGVVAYKLLK